MSVIDEVMKERERQIESCKHGGDTDSFDKSNTKNDWVGFVSAYAGRAADKCFRNEREGQSFRENMIKVAALAIAAVEASDNGNC